MSQPLTYAEQLPPWVREELETQAARSPDRGLYERARDVAAGAFIDIPYVSTDYSGSGTVAWAVQPKHITTTSYDLVGMRMTLALNIAGFSVSGTGTTLRYKIPAGYKAAKTMFNACALLVDNGTRTTGSIGVAADSDIISIVRTDAANWTASTDNSSVLAEITFWVKSQAI